MPEPTPDRCENCGHAPHCPCAAELREMSGEAPAAIAQGLRIAADRFDDRDRAEQQPTRRILTAAEYDAAYRAGHRAAPHAGSVPIDDALTAALAAVGILTPPPEPEPDTCPAMFADHEGGWHQCAEEPDHDPAQGHTDGEWSWPDGDQYARPEPDEAEQRAESVIPEECPTPLTHNWGCGCPTDQWPTEPRQ